MNTNAPLNRHRLLRTMQLPCVAIALLAGGCSVESPGAGNSSVAGGAPPEQGTPIKVAGDEQTEVSKIGYVAVMRDLPVGVKPLVTATFIEFGMQIEPPDREAEQSEFFESCTLNEAAIDPLLLLGNSPFSPFGAQDQATITLNGNIGAGEALMLTSDGSPVMPVEQVVSPTGIGYSGRVADFGLLPDTLRIDIPGSASFPAMPGVVIPLVDPIQGFSPAPGEAVMLAGSFSWTPMQATPEQGGTVFMELTLVNLTATLSCTVIDDGAFSFGDAQMLFDQAEFPAGVLVSVVRRTRLDTAGPGAHVIATNSSVISVQRPEQEFTGDDLTGEALAVPPKLIDPLLIALTPDYPTSFMSDFDRVGCDGQIHIIRIPPDQDALITMSPAATGPILYPLWVTGGRNVHMLGIEMRPIVQPGCDVGEAHQVRDPGNLNIHPRFPGGKMIRFEQSHTTFFEGMDLDLQGLEGDCFVLRNPPGMSVEVATSQRHVAFVNTRCTGYESLDKSPIGDGLHGDFFQNQGSDNMSSFVMDTVTYKGSGNGITLHAWNGEPGYPKLFSMRRVNYEWDERYVGDDPYDRMIGLPFTAWSKRYAFEDTYFSDGRRTNYGIMNGQRIGGFSIPGLVQKVEGMFEGPPPGGDFAPAELTGFEYVSPFPAPGGMPISIP